MTGVGEPSQHPNAHLLLHRGEVFGCQRAGLGEANLPILAAGEHPVDHAAVEVHSALNKGTQALWLEVLIAAQRLGVADLLERQLQQSRADLHDWALRQFPALPSKAYRWAPEMVEISKTLEAAGITPKVFQGAAEIYRFVAGTALGQETPENRDKARTGRDVVRLLTEERSRS